MSTEESIYRSDIILGKKYREKNTGLEGVATAIFFFENACERVQLDYVYDGDLKQVSFDAPQLTEVESGVQARSERSGGPAREHQVRPADGKRAER